MKYLRIYHQSISDGPGIRVSIYVSGCRNHCPGCHNPDSWDFNLGEEFTDKTIQEILKALSFDYITGLTICGGEPMEPENQQEILKLAKAAREAYPWKTIWCYTGYNWEDLQPGGKRCFDHTDRLLSYIDVLVVGPYIEQLRDITKNNLWRGSTNQRVISVLESKVTGTPQFVENIPNNN